MKKNKRLKPEKRNKKSKELQSSYKIRWTTYLLLVIDFCAVVSFVLMYGPFSFFRDWFVTSSMWTGQHRYFARTFFTEEGIMLVLKNNAIKSVDEDTDIGNIEIGNWQSDGNYSSIYEQQILERDFDNQEYKIIEISENRANGWLIVIYDPSRVSLATANRINNGGNVGSDIAKQYDATVFINASAYSRSGGKLIPHGTTIQDGKVVSIGKNMKYTDFAIGIIGFTHDDKLVLCKDTQENITKYNFRDAVTFGPTLIVNGKASETSGKAGGMNPRAAIGQRKDGIVLFLIIDGRSSKNGVGANFNDLTQIFLRYGAVNAANLDGGGSTTLIVEGQLVNRPCGAGSCGYGVMERYIPNGWIFK